MKEREKRLTELSRPDQAIILAQMTRNQFALNHWQLQLSNVKSLPIYRHEVKRLHRQIERELSIYDTCVRGMFRKDGSGIDAYEIMLDNTYEFHKDIQKQLFYYEQGMARVIMKHNLPEHEFLSKMSCCKDLLDLVALCDGCELAKHPDIRTLAYLGGHIVEQPLMQSEGNPCMPTVMGHFFRMCCKMNMAIIRALGMKEDLTYNVESDPETIRTCDIVSTNLVDALMNYNAIMVMYEGEGGKTMKEAKNIVQERKEEAKAIRDKEAKRKANREQIKKAKAESKQ